MYCVCYGNIKSKKSNGFKSNIYICTYIQPYLRTYMTSVTANVSMQHTHITHANAVAYYVFISLRIKT